jgi:hypothetical protein
VGRVSFVTEKPVLASMVVESLLGLVCKGGGEGGAPTAEELLRYPESENSVCSGDLGTAVSASKLGVASCADAELRTAGLEFSEFRRGVCVLDIFPDR